MSVGWFFSLQSCALATLTRRDRHSGGSFLGVFLLDRLIDSVVQLLKFRFAKDSVVIGDAQTVVNPPTVTTAQTRALSACLRVSR